MNKKQCEMCGEEKDIKDFDKFVDLPKRNALKYKKESFSKYCFECTKKLVEKREEKGKEYDGYLPTDLRKAKLFAFWQSIPSIVKGNKYLKKAKDRAITGLGDDDAMIERLVSATTLTKVSEILDVSVETIKQYRGSDFVKEWTEKFDTHNNVMRFKKDVDYSFTRATIKHADAARYKLWYQIHMGWVPEEKKTHDMDETSMKKIEGQLRELGMRNKDIIEAEEGELDEDEKQLLEEAKSISKDE